MDNKDLRIMERCLENLNTLAFFSKHFNNNESLVLIGNIMGHIIETAEKNGYKYENYKFKKRR